MIIISKEGTYGGIDHKTAQRYSAKQGKPVTVSKEEGEFLRAYFPDRFRFLGGTFPLSTGNGKTFTDIIVPAYKNEDWTIACFESIKRCTEPGTYKLFWVDGASPEKSRTKVSKVLLGVNHQKIFLDENIGFVGATNAGLKESRAPTVCLLNNDTIVSAGWLKKLTSTLLENEIGIIGAMSQWQNAEVDKAIQQSITKFWEKFSFPDKINLINKKNQDDVDEYNKLLEEKFKGKYINAPGFVAFYAAVLRREVLDAVGFLNEEFGIGLYDDCDYCEEAVSKGFSLAVALDTLIYHESNVTFKITSTIEEFADAHYKNSLLYQKNRKRREESQAL